MNMNGHVDRATLLIVLLLVLAACTPSAPTAAPANTPPPAEKAASATAAPAQSTTAPLAPEPTTAPAAAVATGGKDTLTIAQSVDPQTLDPFETTAAYVGVFAQICEPLIYWDSDDQGNAVIKKLLATDYKWLNDTTLQFKLRTGVTFSNGEPFNAESAKFSIEQLFAAFNYSQWLKDQLKEVEIVDPTTINVVVGHGDGQLSSRSPRLPEARPRNVHPVAGVHWTVGIQRTCEGRSHHAYRQPELLGRHGQVQDHHLPHHPG